MDLTRYLPPVLALLVLLVIFVLLARWGWRRRAARQSDLPELPLPVAGGKALSWTADPVAGDGVYVVSTLAGRPLERVTARGLGFRRRVQITDADDAGHQVLSIAPVRGSQGSAWFLIPWADVLSVHTAPGMIGKWVGGDGLLVIRWRLGSTELDTGFRLDDRADQDRLLALAAERLGTDPSDPPAPTPELPATDPQPRKELP
ncbi:hypothetical protein Bra3105_02965 [Brachybacterium halotolerans subsp. kimchii]|uniref:PH-like domain-containing protein n=1 Tax=Brachybacterium halotolerans TaxID=2795215 RepID=UPI001E53480F|nr:hypothetical protein [Brachybacterium halotolerans]UEJ83299.1 hypothetical protein Bra3105_02965 [Brachybacterium halotolerans subsp. kimchii]